ncbi:MAG: FG-GAP repeat domain-containing protein [Bacteroidia bacterium]
MNQLQRFLPLIFVFLMFSAHGQTLFRAFHFEQNAGPALKTANGNSFTAFTGGFHKPHFNNLDVNLDGVEDLVAFDKDDYQSLVFIGNGDSTNPEFVFAPEFEQLIPKCYAWVRILDFNGDGLKDIFTSNNIGGVMVYKNKSTSNKLIFELYNDDVMYYDTDINFYTPLFVAPSDVPAVDDIDGDGDLDLLSFDSGGGNLTYYQNQSVETYGHKDSFNFIVPTYCWGRFQESDTSNEIVFAPTCYLYKKKKHAGSNMLTIDYDNDGDKDLLLSDVAYKTVLLLENGWNPNSTNGHNRDTIIKAHTNFPSSVNPVQVDLFPTISSCDIDFDGVNDLLFAPSSQEENFVVMNTWAYLNKGSKAKPKFEFLGNDFLQNQTIDKGEFSRPAVMDADGDGDLDLFVCAPRPYTNFEYDKAYYKLSYYENIGDSSKAIYELKDDDFLNLTEKEYTTVYPVFGDADNNGTIDLLLGLENGRIAFYSNANMPDQIADFSFVTGSYQSIKVSGHAAPCVYDINHDGDNDLLIGGLNGKLAYYEWDNTLDSLILETDEFLEINVGHPTAGIGFSVPRIGNIDGKDGDEIVVANSFGFIKYFYDIDIENNKSSLGFISKTKKNPQDYKSILNYKKKK